MLPLLAFVYSTDNTSHSLSLKLNVAALFGATIGQLFFGIAADIWGRKRLYGLELILIIFGILGITQASGTGMTPLYWILFWRFTMGIGIGGGYPLSAVITAE
jgi:PHS family inorganic phosphate transporter-like MFS transporter